jgi:hypothetical protein
MTEVEHAPQPATDDGGPHGRGGVTTEPVTADLGDTVELLALVAHLQDVAFARMAEDAREAPLTAQRLALSRLAATAVGRRDQVLDRIAELGGAPETVLASYEQLFDDFDARTEPSTWWERLLRTYVCDGVVEDFCRLASGALEAPSRALVLAAVDDSDQAELAVGELAAAGADDEVLVSRLALWGRRLVGESLGVVQQAMAGHPALARLVTAAAAQSPDAAPDGPVRLFGELTAQHTRRMTRLGLTA